MYDVHIWFAWTLSVLTQIFVKAMRGMHVKAHTRLPKMPKDLVTTPYD